MYILIAQQNQRQHNVSREKNELMSRSKNVTIEKISGNYDSPKNLKKSTKFYKNNGNIFGNKKICIIVCIDNGKDNNNTKQILKITFVLLMKEMLGVYFSEVRGILSEEYMYRKMGLIE